MSGIIFRYQVNVHFGVQVLEATALFDNRHLFRFYDMADWESDENAVRESFETECYRIKQTEEEANNVS